MNKTDYMKRCLELAQNGLRQAMPNPSVGAVIVYNNTIIGEGFTSEFGGNHAEVNAINSVKNKAILSKSTIYVSLEPCAHFGKTPPCCNLIIEHKIPHIIIGCVDPFSEVSGKGIELLKKAGCNVETGILEQECSTLNKRFFTFHEKKRPYIILKWATSLDGFIDKKRTDNSTPAQAITCQQSNTLVHQWRSEEMGIMVGTNTVFLDNPNLDVRKVKGKNPIRIIIDKSLRLSTNLNVFNSNVKTIVFTEKSPLNSINNLEYIVIDFSKEVLNQVLKALHKRSVLSVFVEGGTQLLQAFIDTNTWDEAKVFTTNKLLQSGVEQPKIKNTNCYNTKYYNDYLIHYFNNKITPEKC